MKSNFPSLQDLLKVIDIRFTMIKIAEPNRSECEWIIGLDDNKGEPQLNYVECKSKEDAEKLIEYILLNYEKVTRGTDYGQSDDKRFVYFKTS